MTCFLRLTPSPSRYEIDRDEKIGIGFFSDVFRGTWRGRTVAIKVLAESTPRTLFVREIGIWKTLHHPNVLPLYGASSATGDPPWFFVSPYMKNGTLVEYLKRVEHEDRPVGLGVGLGANHVLPSMPLRSPGGRSVTLPSPWSAVSMLSPNAPSETTPPGSRRRTPPRDSSNEVPREWDLFRFMHEIAKGMEYLHEKGVLHGDLKASNVLVSDYRYRCVIADFGLSEMKSEAYRISGTPPPRKHYYFFFCEGTLINPHVLDGTLRWQSPEIMTGQLQLTPEVDIWAFSICCVEVLTMGRMPWPLMDDISVRHFVLSASIPHL
jgi:serine/threonine protein kinase